MSGEGKGDILRVECLVYSGVVGFLTPVKFWNAGKKSEWEDRVTFALPARDKMLDVVAREPKPEPGGFWLPNDWNEAALKLPGVEDE